MAALVGSPIKAAMGLRCGKAFTGFIGLTGFIVADKEAMTFQPILKH
jgi:hypothetical protein